MVQGFKGAQEYAQAAPKPTPTQVDSSLRKRRNQLKLALSEQGLQKITFISELTREVNQIFARQSL